MKTIASAFLIYSFSAVLLSTVACSQQKDEQNQKDETNAEQVKAQLEETYDVLEDFLYENKEKIVNQANTELEKADEELEKLDKKMQAELNIISEEAKIKKQAAIENLRQKRAQLKMNIDSIQDASSAVWGKVKTEFKNASADLEKALQEAYKELEQNK